MLLLVSFQEIFQILMNCAQELVNLSCLRPHTLLSLLDLKGHLIKNLVSIMARFPMIIVDFVKQNFADFDQLVMIKLVVFVSG